VVSYF